MLCLWSLSRKGKDLISRLSYVFSKYRDEQLCVLLTGARELLLAVSRAGSGIWGVPFTKPPNEAAVRPCMTYSSMDALNLHTGPASCTARCTMNEWERRANFSLKEESLENSKFYTTQKATGNDNNRVFSLLQIWSWLSGIHTNRIAKLLKCICACVIAQCHSTFCLVLF